MKQLVRLGVVLIMVLGLAGPAASTTVTNVFTANVDKTLSGSLLTTSWEFNDAGSNGGYLDYLLANETVLSITLTVDVNGIDGTYTAFDYAGEGGLISLDNGSSIIGAVGGNTLSITLNVMGFLDQLKADDTFYMAYLTRGTGPFDGFNITTASLEVVTHAPIPTSALLLFVGLAGIMRAQRRL